MHFRKEWCRQNVFKIDLFVSCFTCSLLKKNLCISLHIYLYISILCECNVQSFIKNILVRKMYILKFKRRTEINPYSSYMNENSCSIVTRITNYLLIKEQVFRIANFKSNHRNIYNAHRIYFSEAFN